MDINKVKEVADWFQDRMTQVLGKPFSVEPGWDSKRKKVICWHLKDNKRILVSFHSSYEQVKIMTVKDWLDSAGLEADTNPDYKGLYGGQYPGEWRVSPGNRTKLGEILRQLITMYRINF